MKTCFVVFSLEIESRKHFKSIAYPSNFKALKGEGVRHIIALFPESFFRETQTEECFYYRKTTILFPISNPAKFFLLPRLFQAIDLSIPPFYIYSFICWHYYVITNTNGRNNSLCMNEINRVYSVKMCKMMDATLLSY